MKKSVLVMLMLWSLAFLTSILPVRAGTVTVSFSSPTVTFTMGQVFSVDLLANLPDSVLGFGVDVESNSTKLLLTSFKVGPLWFPVAGSQSDDVYGIAFPAPVSGTKVLLASLTFTGLGSGSSGLSSTYDSRNLAEGFPLATGGFDTTNLIDEAPQVSQVPEPMTGVLFGLGFFLLVAWGSRSALIERLTATCGGLVHT